MIIQIILCLFIGYLPGNWNPEHAKLDAIQSSDIIIARCVGIESEVSHDKSIKDGKVTINETYRMYYGILRVGIVEKGELAKNSEIRIFIGMDVDPGDVDLYKPSNSKLTMCNSQAGYNINVNMVYKLYLNKVNGAYDLRSGPYSLGLLLRNGKIAYGKLGGEWQEPIDLINETNIENPK